MGRRADPLGLGEQLTAACCQAVVEGRHVGEGLVGPRLAEQRPEVLGRLHLRRLRGRGDQAPPARHDERGAGVPARARTRRRRVSGPAPAARASSASARLIAAALTVGRISHWPRPEGGRAKPRT